MTGFIIGALLLVAITLAIVLLPLLRRGKQRSAVSRQQLNTVIYRDQLAELERDRTQGLLSQVDYEQAQAELQRRLLEDVAPDAAASQAKTGKPGRGLPIALAVSLPVAAVIFYLIIGMPAAIDAPAHQQRFDSDEIEQMLNGLVTKLEKEPENYRGWAMLARSYKTLGRFPEAARAYERTGTMLDSSAELLVDYADTLAAVSEGFTPKVLELIDKALKIEPTNMQGLWLRGSAAYEAKNYAKAITDWEALLAVLPPESEEANVIRSNLAETRHLQAQSGKPSAKAEKSGQAGQSEPAAKVGAGATASIQGRIEVAAAVAGKVPAGATVMVVARPNDGSRMPVAVFMAPASQSMEFILDERTAMNPDNPLAKYPELLLEPRLSRGQQAVPEPGDLFGSAQLVKLGTRGVQLKIDQVRQ